ncbi:MAG TPA: LysM peptidoglycan-binding domain-containing protein [Reyranella sp.]|nr:LysM peptidoglycan-binding domain-containing protein [Reyranella sp.]
MPRTVLWLMAAGAVVTAAVLGEAWRGEPAILSHAAKAAATSSVAPAPSPPVDAATPHTTALPSVPPPTVAMPSFDVALIGPDGRGVIAGRAQPGAKIILLDGDKELAQDQVDAKGEWVIIAQDPPLSAGPHELRVIQHVDGRAPVTSDQVVVAIVPDQQQSGPEKKTLVMIAPPTGAATLVQPPSAAGVPKSGDLVMSTLDYDEGGHVTVTGKATPGAVVRAYINDKMVAEGQTAADGSWRLAPADPVGVGKYKLRLDRLAKDGKPVARLELPFERVPVPPATGNSERLVVVRGDSLWNIARAHYGTGFQHTLIYGANKNQIRDPDLIYPGQVFSLPKAN